MLSNRFVQPDFEAAAARRNLESVRVVRRQSGDARLNQSLAKPVEADDVHFSDEGSIPSASTILWLKAWKSIRFPGFFFVSVVIIYSTIQFDVRSTQGVVIMPQIDQPVDPKLDLVLERVVDVPRHLVWRAWTEPELMKKWFTPRPWETVEVEIDLRPGGKFRTVFRSPEGEVIDNDPGCILEVLPNEKLVWTSALGPGYRPLVSPDGAPVFTAIIRLEEQGDRTKYTAIAKHRDEAGRNAHVEMGFEQGWGAALDQLVKLAKML